MSDEPIHILSVDEILDADDIKEETVEVPEWGGSVKIRALSLKQIARVAQRSIRRNPQTGQDETSREISVLMTIQEGMIEPKMTAEQIKKLGEKSATAVTRIVQAINALGPTNEAVDEADKSLWPEPDAPVSILAGTRATHDLGASDNGNVS